MRHPAWDHAVLVVAGRHYRCIGMGYGAQLESYEWRRPKAGTMRRIAGFDFRVFQTHREGLRVRASWGACINGDIDTLNRRLREVADALRGLVCGA